MSDLNESENDSELHGPEGNTPGKVIMYSLNITITPHGLVTFYQFKLFPIPVHWQTACR